MTTGNLAFTEVTASQNNKYLTVNTALARIANALTETFDANVASGNVTVTADQYQTAFQIRATGAATAGRTVTLPQVERIIVLANASSSDAVSFVRGSTTISVAASTTVLAWTDGTTNGLAKIIDPSAGNIQALLDGISTTQGAILYYNGTDWVALSPGTSGDFLKTQGAGANPVWATPSGTGVGWRIVFLPRDNEPPTSNFATLYTRNNHPMLQFDTTTQESAIFRDVLPATYAGRGLTVTAIWSATSATTGTVGWDVAIERIGVSQDIDSDSFATAQTITAATVSGTSGIPVATSVNIANGSAMDSLAAGELFRLRIRRDVANDTATGDAELLAVHIVEQ